MELELRIVRDPHKELPKQRVRVFSESGDDVGRAADSYWLLTDPKCYLSGHHCTILFRDGAFWIRDTTRNGVSVSGSERPLGLGRKARLAHGDEIKFATCKVLVRVKTHGKPQPGSAIEPEELFSEVFAAASVDEAQNSPQREPAVEHEMENVEAPSQTIDTAVAQVARSSPDSEVEENLKPMEAALRELEPASAVESTGEHEQQHERNAETSHDLVVDEAVESSSSGAVLEVFDPPNVSLQPTVPRRPPLVAMVFVGGLVAGAALAYLLSRISPAFNQTRELEQLTGRPVLVVVTLTDVHQVHALERRGYRLCAVATSGLLMAFVVVLPVSRNVSSLLA